MNGCGNQNPAQENNEGKSFKDCGNFSNLNFILTTGLLGNKQSL